MTILLTNRIDKLSHEVIGLLDELNIKFDDYSFRSGSKEKVDRIKFYLTIHPNVKIIDIYDDREKELVVFREFKKEFSDKYQINIFPVQDGKILNENYYNIKRIIREEIKKNIL